MPFVGGGTVLKQRCDKQVQQNHDLSIMISIQSIIVINLKRCSESRPIRPNKKNGVEQKRKSGPNLKSSRVQGGGG